MNGTTRRLWPRAALADRSTGKTSEFSEAVLAGVPKK